MIMLTFKATIQQEKAFNKVIKAIKDAKKKGLVFYGKQNNLVAYTKQAETYIETDIDGCWFGKGKVIDYLSANVLSDSGADDYALYRTTEDAQNFGGE